MTHPSFKNNGYIVMKARRHSAQAQAQKLVQEAWCVPWQRVCTDWQSHRTLRFQAFPKMLQML